MNWSQLKTILWLRWHLTRNQWFRRGSVAGVFGIIATVLGLIVAAALFAGGLVAGIFAFKDASPMVVLIAWDVIVAAFLFAWTIGLLTELQRSESIDLQRLMHLPVALGQIFTVNFVASHLTLVPVATVPAMVGLGIGLGFGRGPLFLLLVPLTLGTVFMVTAWTYCLRGWLATLMTNPRRRRSIIVGLTLGVVLLGQAPNLYFQFYARSQTRPVPGESKDARAQRLQARSAAREALMIRVADAQRFIPPLWLPVGARAVAEGNPWPALLGTAGCAALGALGLRRAYRGTVRFYHGETGSRAAVRRMPVARDAARGVPSPAKRRKGTLIEWRPRGIPEPAAAMAAATFRSMLRAPEVKMAWATSLVMVIVMGAIAFSRVAPQLPGTVKPFVASGAAAFTLFMLLQFVANQFGLDRDGFRVLVLAPTDRRLLLLGKNLANIPVAGMFGLILVVACSVWLRVPPTAALAAAFQLVTMILLMSIFGNLLSILIPYRIEPGTLKPTKLPGMAMFVMFLCHMVFPFIMLPAFIPPLAALAWRWMGWPEPVPVNLVLSAGMAALAGFAYWQSLAPLGRLFSRREHEILRRVTAGTE